MNKSVPTLLGIVIILLVVVLVVLVYNYQLTQKLGSGATVVGTRGGEMLTGVQMPTEEISPSEALAARQSKVQPVTIMPKRLRAGGREPGRRGRAVSGEATKPGAGK